MEINFYNFKKPMSLITQLDIHLHGIRLKPSATITTSEKGEIFEINLNETKDERVNFLYDETICVPIPDESNPLVPIKSLRIKGTEVTDLYDSNDNELIQYPTNGNPATLSVVNLLAPNGPSIINIPIKPAYEFMKDDAPETSRSVLIDRIWLAGCGFWDNKKNTLGYFVKKIISTQNISKSINPGIPNSIINDDIGFYKLSDNSNSISTSDIKRDINDIPWITKKIFKKRLKDLREKLVPKGIDVIVTIYEKSIDELGDDPNASGISRKKTKNYKDIIPLAKNFIIKKKLTPVDSIEISPFDVSIQAVHNIVSDDSESLFSELLDIMNDIWDSLQNPSTSPETFIDANIDNYDIPGKITEIKNLAKNKLILNSSDAELANNLSRLYVIQQRIKWFEFFNGISINNSLTSVIDNPPIAVTKFRTYKKLARILIPIDMGIKVTKTRKKGVSRFLKRYKYTRTDLGIRFAEIRFVDTSILQKYRKNETQSGVPQYKVDANGNYVLDGNGNKIPLMIENLETGIQEQLVDFPATKPDPIPSDITINYEIPHLPFDTELRKMAIDQFGFYDHSINANTDNIYDSNGKIIFDVEKNIVNVDVFDPNGNLIIHSGSFIPSGYQMFLNTSKNISDMRGGIDIYNKVQFLQTILQDTFGNKRVKLIETNRSVEDQDKLQLGGTSSNFLSWYNYGLGVKILITDDTDTNTIKEGTPDFMKLLDIAEAFTIACGNGDLGIPINVVWCGRLKTGPDNFSWEFLPIGLDHKDSWKLRDSAYNQIEPIVSNSFVDVKGKNLIVQPNVTVSTPYIRSDSLALQNAIRIGSGYWVSPNDIRNFDIPSNLVLKDIQEYLFLIKNKFDGNGTELTNNKNIYDWKLNNPISYKQLILFHSLVGNFNIVRSLMAMDYVERFESFMMSASSENPVDFVRSFLGEVSYKNIKINVTVSSDAAYISPLDGKLYIIPTNLESTQPEGNGNTFGEKQIDERHSKFTSLAPIVSDDPVLDDNQLKLVHKLIKDQILAEFKLIKDSFLNLKTDFLHDSIKTGSNSGLFDELENEFGIISTQDLIPFDQLRGMFNRIEINKSTLHSPDPDGKVRGAGQNIEGNTNDQNQSIFEKLVSNAQTRGVQFVKPGREKVIIEDIVDKPLERTIREVLGTDQLDISDIL